ELDPGERIAGVVHDPNGNPLEGVLLHFGELYSHDTESVLGRVRTDAEGRFEFGGVPRRVREALRGVFHDDGTAVLREQIFVTAFPPDEILAARGEPIWRSPVAKSVVVRPGDADLEIIAANNSFAIDIPLRFVDRDGAPIRAWTPATIIDEHRDVLSGVANSDPEGLRFHTDRTILRGALRAGRSLFRPEGYRWLVVDLAVASSDPQPIPLEPEVGAVDVAILGADEAPIVDRLVALELESGVGVLIGRTDERGRLTGAAQARGALPAKLDRLWVARRGSDRSSDPLETEIVPLDTPDWCSPDELHIEGRSDRATGHESP
ncbi:MAG: hypothetical protein KDC38_19800, partial [Planctomycetes bacterium]|nr:hypothetical protein [Planctomycetota bacterium]